MKYIFELSQWTATGHLGVHFPVVRHAGKAHKNKLGGAITQHLSMVDRTALEMKLSKMWLVIKVPAQVSRFV